MYGLSNTRIGSVDGGAAVCVGFDGHAAALGAEPCRRCLGAGGVVDDPGDGSGVYGCAAVGDFEAVVAHVTGSVMG